MIKPNCAECKEYEKQRHQEWFKYWLTSPNIDYVQVSEEFHTNKTSVRVHILAKIETMGIPVRDKYDYPIKPSELKSKVLLALQEKEVI